MNNTPASHIETFNNERLEKREKRKADALEKFRDAGIVFLKKKNGRHILIKSDYGLIDYYPETSGWYIRQTKQTARGTQTLINFLKQN